MGKRDLVWENRRVNTQIDNVRFRANMTILEVRTSDTICMRTARYVHFSLIAPDVAGRTDAVRNRDLDATHEGTDFAVIAWLLQRVGRNNRIPVDRRVY